MAQSWQRRLFRMKVVCAECEREGKPSYLGEREPYDNPATTHGICSSHQQQALEAQPSSSFPDAEMLIVVRPNDTELYEYLSQRFAGVSGVRVILDRRRADRRIRQGRGLYTGLHRRAIQTEAAQRRQVRAHRSLTVFSASGKTCPNYGPCGVRLDADSM